jgi:hypothetical protein
MGQTVSSDPFVFNPNSAVAIAAKSEEQTFHSEARFFPDYAGKKGSPVGEQPVCSISSSC